MPRTLKTVRSAAKRQMPAVRTDARERGDPAHGDFRITDWPFYLIARTAGRYAMDMEDALRPIDLDLASWRTLMWLHETDSSSVSEIAEGAVMRLSTMTRVVQRLEKRGLVKVAQRAADARVTEVFITPSGERIVSQVRGVASKIYHLAFRDLSAQEIATLNDLLRRVFQNLDFTAAV